VLAEFLKKYESAALDISKYSAASFIEVNSWETPFNLFVRRIGCWLTRLGESGSDKLISLSFEGALAKVYPL